MCYFDKPANHANLIERKNKRKINYKAKFLTILILKNKISKINFKKNHNKKSKRNERKTIYIYKKKQITKLNS
jgi:hypothetical protein